jgi:hypothetical protein
MIPKTGSVEYNVMATKMAPCAAAISGHITTSCAAALSGRHGQAGKSWFSRMIVRAGFQVDRLGAGPR